MAQYAVNEQGVQALRNLSKELTDAVEQIETLTNNLASTADEYNDTLGPHKASLDEVLEEIREAEKSATDPAKSVAETLDEIADDYEEIIENDGIKNSGGK